LGHIQTHEKVAKVIAKALKQDGNDKLLFVVTEEALHIRPRMLLQSAFFLM